MATEWYYAIDGDRLGPVSSGELKQLAASGEITPDDLIWRDGMPEWTPARKVKGLFADAAPPPPPVRQPQPEIPVRIVQPKTSKVATVAKWTSIGWSTFCLFGICAGLANVGSSLETTGNEYEEAGAAIGLGCGMGIWFVIWAAIAVPSLVIWLLARNK